jgi:hypothetical protein
MKRFKELLTEITMNNPGVMFLLEGRGTLPVKAHGGDMKDYLRKYLGLVEPEELHTFLTTPGQTIDLPYNDPPSDGSPRTSPENGIILHLKRGKGDPTNQPLVPQHITTLHNINGMIHASGPDVVDSAGVKILAPTIPLNKLHKPTGEPWHSGGLNNGWKFQDAIVKLLNTFETTRRGKSGGGGTDPDAQLTIKRNVVTPEVREYKNNDKDLGGSLNARLTVSGNPDTQKTVKHLKNIEIKLNAGAVVLSQSVLHYHPEKGWHSPDKYKNDPQHGVTRRLLEKIRDSTGTTRFLDHIKNIIGDRKKILTTPKTTIIPQPFSEESENLKDAQEHLASKNDFLIIGPSVYTLNPEIHDEFRSRGIPSTMLHHDENINEGKTKLLARAKNRKSGNVDVSMRFTSLHPSEAVLSPSYIQHLNNYTASLERSGGTGNQTPEKMAEFHKILRDYIPEKTFTAAEAQAAKVKTARVLKEKQKALAEQEAKNSGNIS